MKILVTGGAGFIGSNFLKYMINKYPNYKFVCLDILTYAGSYSNLLEIKDNQNFSFVKGDITDKKLVDKLFKKEKFDIVINFAAESHVDNSFNNPELFILTNVVGTQTLLEASKKYKVKRFHQVSTDEVYGFLPTNDKSLKFTENNILKPTSPYSASKAAADLIVESYYKSYKLPITISRCTNNFGPNQFPEKLIPCTINSIINNRFIPVHGDGSYIRDWIYVLDHCKGIDKIIHEGKIGEIYNIGVNVEKTNMEIIEFILNYFKAPKDLIKFVKDRPINDTRYSIDATKAKNELNWNSNSDFEQNLIETIEWYKKNQHWLKEMENKKEEIQV